MSSCPRISLQLELQVNALTAQLQASTPPIQTMSTCDVLPSPTCMFRDHNTLTTKRSRCLHQSKALTHTLHLLAQARSLSGMLAIVRSAPVLFRGHGQDDHFTLGPKAPQWAPNRLGFVIPSPFGGA